MERTKHQAGMLMAIKTQKKDQSYFFSEKWQKAIEKSEEEVKKEQYKVYTTGKVGCWS